MKRHELTDEQWDRVQPFIPRKKRARAARRRIGG